MATAFTHLRVVAHRGVAGRAPENTVPAFERAIALGADAVELDVRLTRDRVPVVFHHYYLEGVTTLAGPIFTYALAELRAARFLEPDGAVAGQGGAEWQIPTLEEVLAAIGGRIGLEIHAWDVNDEVTLRCVAGLGVRQVCTDRLAEILDARRRYTAGNGGAGDAG